MDTFQTVGTPNRSRFGVFKLSKPKRLKARHGLPDSISEGVFVYRALSELDADGAWGTWLGEQRDASGVTRPVLLKHTGENNRTRAGADALWLEALLTLKLDGAQVVPLLDYGVLDGRPFAIYGFEEGVFLAQVIEGLRERGRRLPSGVAVGIVLQACDLVKRLHRLSLGEDAPGGFVHGSLCPRNFMLTERGDVKVMGLIGVRPVGRVVGREHVPAAAAAYASPDLLGGAPVTPAVDVYSLGAVLQELIGDGTGDVERDELANIVRGLLQQGPTGGFSTVEAFANALQDAVRRTGTVVARQSIGAQVRGVCEQYLLERRRQVRGLRGARAARDGVGRSARELERPSGERRSGGTGHQWRSVRG
jgi:serine/threonine protein kinase